MAIVPITLSFTTEKGMTENEFNEQYQKTQNGQNALIDYYNWNIGEDELIATLEGNDIDWELIAEIANFNYWCRYGLTG